MAGAEGTESPEITEFTTTAESVDEKMEGSWADKSSEEGTPLPDVLKHLINNGLRFKEAPFFSSSSTPKLVKNLSVYFSVDTIVTSQTILEAFDNAGIDIDFISSIQRKSSSRSWVVSFDNQLAKETALEVASIEIAGTTVFLGDCENRLVLVKIYEAPAELPDTAVIGRLNYYGRVLSFRRDKIAQFIENGVRTARMSLNRHIPSTINLAGEFLRIWYPNQPKTCRNCGSEDHLAKDCSSVRCFNCEQPGHSTQNCGEPPKCTVCRAEDHRLGDCPYVHFSANVDSGPRGEQTKEEKQREKDKYKEKLERAKQKQQTAEKQQVRMQMEARQAQGGRKDKGDKSDDEDKGRSKDKDKGKNKDKDESDDGQKRRKERRSSADRRREERGRSDDEREKEEENRRQREREDRHHDYNREYPRRDYHRDRSTRRDNYYSDDDDGWTQVSSRRRRRYDR